jgi:4-hydroxy-tetrahydrodipicolinate reductase
MAKGLCILGPSGRMGAMLIEQARERTDVRVVAAVDRVHNEIIGREVCPGVVATGDMAAGLAAADVYIDFTTPEGTRAALGAALVAALATNGGTRPAAVIGTTGLDADALAAIDAAGEHLPVLYAPNFSLGVNVLLGLAERAARALGTDFDIEIVEMHHKHKRDAPSGTALALASALSAGRDRGLHNRLSRAGDVGVREDHELGVLAVRGGDVAGEHTAYFLGPNERLELTHRASSRAIFARGALRAAAWIAGRSPGRYTMIDVLGL